MQDQRECLQKKEKSMRVRLQLQKKEASKLMALMSLAVKCGQTVEVQIEGSDEEAAYEGMKSFFEANL